MDQVEPVKLPCWEIYALVANSKNTEYDEYLFDDSHHEKSSFMNMKVRLLRARNKNDIVDQYTKFTEIYEHQYIIYDDNRKTISETIRICKERGILKDYLERHEHELVSMYEALYNERNALEFEMYQERLEGRKEGIEKGREETRNIMKLIIRMHRKQYDRDEIVQAVMDDYGLTEAESAKNVDSFLEDLDEEEDEDLGFAPC